MIQKARDQGWTVLHSGGGHLIFRSPDKSVPQVVVPSTPGGGNRSIENTKAKLKRSGLVTNRRRVRRNPRVSYGLIAAGVAAVAAVAWMASRPSAPASALPGALAANPNAAAVIAARREPEIARLMARGMTRADAEARYDRAVGAVFTAASALTTGLRPTSGLGSYYRS